jgi:hypothetical protein
MKIEQCDIAIASRIKTALEQSEGASNEIHIAARIVASHRIAERERCAGIADDHSKRWGEMWRNKESDGGVIDVFQHGRLAGFSDGASVVAKAIRNEIERTDNETK